MNENAFRFMDSLDAIIAVTGLVSLLFAALAGIMFARGITKPVLSVIEQTKQIAGGDYTLRPENNANSLEIYELTQAVGTMAAKLDEQEKLRIRLTDDVAHELRTPLTNISSRLEMMSDGIWEPTRERIASCYEEVGRISRLVDDMEKLHSINSENADIEKTEFSVKDMLENTAAAFEGEFSAKSISADIECEDIYINADRDKLVRAVTNLISNSVKYSDKGGKIKLTAAKQNDMLELTVSDTGSGIPKEDLPYIFERFYRADKSRDRSTGGSGIGLAVTKATVDAHGGKISAESAVGNGTKIIISLPLK